jgi:hypothetical protein
MNLKETKEGLRVNFNALYNKGVFAIESLIDGEKASLTLTGKGSFVVAKGYCSETVLIPKDMNFIGLDRSSYGRPYLNFRSDFQGKDSLFELFLDDTDLELVVNTKRFSVPVVYQVWGRVEIEAESVEDARKKLADQNFVEKMGLPENPSYLDDSYMIDEEGEMKNIETGEFYPISEE